jgi:lipopolysaccharide transport system ATP-binding protein
MLPAIEIRNLGKQYKLAAAQPYVALRDVIAGSLKNIFNASQKTNTKFWALQNIDLDIEPGERVGIIGRNGAGKSTLLKIISRITPPTTGKAIIRGRVGSLLEVGTGFHPELTGRENIYLNGSILGLKKAEIDKQFDAIIQFSGVEKFIDMPLKHYSSGMQLRLAFAVAAHLEPEILLIDEVLAVGDAEFQRKCITKMEEVSKKDGRTILFVSHQLNSIMKLCTKGIWINKGQLQFAGPVNEAVELYSNSVRDDSSGAVYKREDITGDHFFLSAEVLTPNINVGEDLSIRIGFSEKFRNRNLVLNINVLDEFGELISHIINEDDGFSTEHLQGNSLLVKLRELNLLPGRYFLSFWAGLDMMHGIDYIEKAVAFEIDELNNYTQRIAPFPGHSKIIIRSTWQAE